ncbi:hypothetical protein OE88DRAFT_1735682 [Heliocybe sulcata]|uniref:Uncharacterized protein n=1 Tax=Heliocybe sulcata TaxID=5364 RepID=A0A5C3N198_9AGAM|nr:hypothetical protein OE88DRAFT_1735682 [Heliocybe sulcata]
MPHILQGSPPDILILYCTHPLDPSTIQALKSDFALAANDRYNPLVKLHISERTDFQGYSPEEIRRQLEREGLGQDGIHGNDFLVADEQTNRDNSVVYASRWARRDDFYPGALVESPDWPKEGKLPFLHKLRIHMHYAPVLWVNLSIANVGIPESYKYPFDPNEPLTTVEDGGADWRKEPPPPAYVSASPRSYIVSDDPEDTGIFMPRPPRVYRLTEEAAERLGLVPRWSVGWHAKQDPEEHMQFAQNWKTE